MLSIPPASKNLMRYAVAVAAVIFSTHAAPAATLVYTLTGVGAGTISGTPFSNAAFTVSFTQNTTSLNNPAPGYYAYNGISGKFTDGG